MTTDNARTTATRDPLFMRRLRELTPEEKTAVSMDVLWKMDKLNPANRPPFSTHNREPFTFTELSCIYNASVVSKELTE